MSSSDDSDSSSDYEDTETSDDEEVDRKILSMYPILLRLGFKWNYPKWAMGSIDWILFG
jgi:hypothetical protein